MTDPSIWNQIFIWPILNALIALNNGFVFLGAPGSFGLAIVTLTIIVRLLLYPLTTPQLKTAQKMAELKPHLDALKEKHGHDREKLMRAQADLYREHGVNPVAGCLPLLVSLPFFIALYQVFWKVLGNGNLSAAVEQINKIVYAPFLKIESLDLYFLGVNLAEKPSNWQAVGWGLLLVPPLTAFLYWLQTKMMTPLSVVKKESPKEKKGEIEDVLSSMTKGPMSWLFPLMFGLFSYQFPVGLSLYWNTYTVLGIAQQYFIIRGKKTN